MIHLTLSTMPRRLLCVAPNLVSAVIEAGPNSQGTLSYVRLRDGAEYGVIEKAETISKAVHQGALHE